MALLSLFANWAVTALVLLALVLSYAVRRTMYRCEMPLLAVGRNLGVGGWALLSLHDVWFMFRWGYIPSAPIVLLGTSVLALGTVLRCLVALADEESGTPCDRCPASSNSNTGSQ